MLPEYIIILNVCTASINRALQYIKQNSQTQRKYKNSQL